MDQFSKPVLTTKFLNIIAGATNSANSVVFKRVIVSSDIHTLADLAAFDDTMIKTTTNTAETTISNVNQTNNSIQISAVLSSNGNPSDYQFNTVLFTATYQGQEFLAFSQIANYPVKVPAGSNSEVNNLTLSPKITISSTSVISVTVSPTAIATNNRVDKADAKLQSNIDSVAQAVKTATDALANGVVQKSGPAQTVDAQTTFTKPISGSITGNAGSASKLSSQVTYNFSGDVSGSVTTDGSNGSSVNLVVNHAKQADNAQTANGLSNARKISLAGDAQGNVTFDGKSDTTLNINVNHATNADNATQAQQANKLTKPITLTLATDVTGSVSIDGSSNQTLNVHVNHADSANSAGNALTANRLQTSASINGVPFNGVSDININANTPLIDLNSSQDLLLLPQGIYWIFNENMPKNVPTSVKYGFAIVNRRNSASASIQIYDIVNGTNWINSSIGRNGENGTWTGWKQLATTDLVNQVQSTANTALTNAQTAQGTANIALTNANSALNNTKHATSADQLTTSRNINGVPFNGLNDITIFADEIYKGLSGTEQFTTLTRGLYWFDSKTKLPNFSGTNQGFVKIRSIANAQLHATIYATTSNNEPTVWEGVYGYGASAVNWRQTATTNLVSQAQSTANTALSNANQAETDAQIGIKNAQTAQLTANQALSNAQNANNAINNAQTVNVLNTTGADLFNLPSFGQYVFLITSDNANNARELKNLPPVNLQNFYGGFALTYSPTNKGNQMIELRRNVLGKYTSDKDSVIYIASNGSGSWKWLV